MRYGELLLKGEAKDLYQGILSQPNRPLKLKLQVLISHATYMYRHKKFLGRAFPSNLLKFQCKIICM